MAERKMKRIAAQAKDQVQAKVVVTVPFDVQHEPVPQPMPLDERRREWERRKENYTYPYKRQNIGQRIMGEVVKYRLDPIWMTDSGINATCESNYYRTDRPCNKD